MRRGYRGTSYESVFLLVQKAGLRKEMKCMFQSSHAGFSDMIDFEYVHFSTKLIMEKMTPDYMVVELKKQNLRRRK